MTPFVTEYMGNFLPRRKPENLPLQIKTHKVQDGRDPESHSIEWFIIDSKGRSIAYSGKPYELDMICDIVNHYEPKEEP